MVPRSFRYITPSSTREAIALLAEFGDKSKVLAGGMSLIPIMKLRLASPEYVIDINPLKELSYIREDSRHVAIGAMTRYRQVETSGIIKNRVPMLIETLGLVGDPQVRNRGTVGGSLAHCDPSGDLGAAILALRGEMKIEGEKVERVVAADDFFVDTFTSAVKPTELLTEVRIPMPPAGSGGAYVKLERKAGDFATVGIAAQISLDKAGRCAYAGIGMTAVGEKNLRAADAESVLKGNDISEDRISEASQAAANESRPADDALRGSAEYKREMVGVYTSRALKLAVQRAKGGA